MPVIPLGWSQSVNKLKKFKDFEKNENQLKNHVISCNNYNNSILESPPESETANLMRSRALEIQEEQETPSILESLKSFVKIKTLVANTFGSTCCWFLVGAAQMWLLQMFVRRAEEKEMQKKTDFVSERGLSLNVTCDLCKGSKKYNFLIFGIFKFFMNFCVMQ